MANEQRMTIHRGLSELKLIDAKIEKQIQILLPVGLFQREDDIAVFDGGNRLLNTNTKEDKFKEDAKAKYQSIIDLIERKDNIKKAIVDINSKTNVTVAGVTMTIADAITRKTSIKHKEALLAELKKKHTQNQAAYNNLNDQVQDKAHELMKTSAGKENVKLDDKAIIAFGEQYKELNKWKLVDAMNIEIKIQELDSEIENFKAEVDAVLSEINSTTFIFEGNKDEQSL